MATDTLHILVAGRHEEIVPTVIRLLRNTQGWAPVSALSNAEAVTHIDTHQVDILLLSSGISEADEQELRTYIHRVYPQAIIIQHYGGGSGLLVAEIYEALAKRQ